MKTSRWLWAMSIIGAGLAAGACTDSPTRVSPPATVTISPSTLELETGDVVPLTAVVADASGASLDVRVTWSVSDATIATVKPTGNLTADLTATAPGDITVSASAGAANDTCRGSIARRVASISVTLVRGSVGPGGTTEATATVLDGDGAALTDSVVWTSSATDVATVVPTGPLTATVTGGAAGTATIGAKLRKTTGSSDVSVVPITSVVITSTGTDEPLGIGATLQLTAAATSAQGPVPVRITWASDNTAVATVDPTGLVTTVGRGDANITAAVGSVVSAPVAVKVTGGETETAGNNISWPVIFAEGVPETMVIRPASTETAAFAEFVTATATDPTVYFWYSGNTVDQTYPPYYVQGTASTWRAQVVDGSAQPKYAAEAAWGDNLAGDASLSAGHPIRIEVALSATGVGTLRGFNMTVLANASSPDEVQGTNGTLGDFTPLLYTSAFTFTIDGPDGTVTLPKPMAAETNVGGRLVYGAQFTPAVAGVYTLRFRLGSGSNATITSAVNGVVDSSVQSSIRVTVQ